MKVWVASLGKNTDQLAEDQGWGEWGVEKGCYKYQLWLCHQAQKEKVADMNSFFLI